MPIVVGLSSASGIGGGVILMPLLMVSFKLFPQDAVPVSTFNILIGSIIKLSMGGGSSKASSGDYESATLMLPLMLLGSQVGVLIN